MIFIRNALYALIFVEIIDLSFSSLLVEQKYIAQTFYGTNVTNEIQRKKSGSEITCGVYCNRILSCVAFLFSNTVQTCLLLDKLVTTDPNSPSDGSWSYFVKATDCPVSWENNGKNKYCFVKIGLQWTPAKDSCISMGAHLLEIETEAEQTWIQDKASGDTWWIGGTDAKSEGTFYWEHSFNPLNFTYWTESQPDGARLENCIVLGNDRRWHDYPCSTVRYYICEK